MPPTTRQVRPEVLTDAEYQSEVVARNLERLAWLMDRAIPIPGTKLSVGLDAILGLIPGAGDFLCGLIQTGLVLTALNHYRVPKVVAARMAANVLIDLAVGTIPMLGDLFDAGFKANTRNLKLLSEVRKLQSEGQPVPAAPSVWYLVGIGVILVSALLLLFVGLVALAALVWKAVTG
jgi:hypothetical protein